MSSVKRARAGHEEANPCTRERIRNRRPSQKGEVDTFHSVANKQALRAKLIMIIP